MSQIVATRTWQPVAIRVEPELAQELARFVRLLASSGKSQFQHYLHTPLSHSDFRSGSIQEPVIRIIDKINAALNDPATRQTVDYKIKLLISRALDESLSALGDAVIFVLEKCTNDPFVATENSVLYLVNLIGPHLYNFHAKHSEQSVDLFREKLQTSSVEEIESAMAPVTLGSATKRVELDHRIRALFSQIMVASRKDDLIRCRKLTAEYMVRYCDQENYNEEGVTQIIEALDKREPGFVRSLREIIAVQLFYQITTSVKKSDMKSTIAAIRKYANIFGGDPSVRFFYEIDKLERILYQILKERNLWSKVGR